MLFRSDGSDFPGFVGKIQIAGSGVTRSLRGVTVVLSNPGSHRKGLSLLDTCGLGAELSKYGKMNHISIAPYASKGTGERDFEDAVKIAGLKIAVFLAQVSLDQKPDDTEVYDLDIPKSFRKTDLPRVAYYYQLYTPQHDYLGVSDPCFYGTGVGHLMPTIIHPNEILDGGITGTYAIKALDTYSIQNHGLIKELYRRHGTEHVFAGVVCGVANTDPVDRKRKAVMASSLIKNVLGADGVVFTKVHGGMPHVDMGLVAEECEKLGVKTAISVQPYVTTSYIQIGRAHV